LHGDLEPGGQLGGRSKALLGIGVSVEDPSLEGGRHREARAAPHAQPGEV
jgi:hypothetical protein